MTINKRGLSPIIATTLLILMAVIIAAIIFIWVKSFIGEKLQKDVGSGPEAIENFCKDLDFSADVYISESENIISVQNNGDIPIYGVELRKRGFASSKVIANIEFDLAGVTSGDTQEKPFVYSISEGDELTVMPILLGVKPDGSEKKSYVCQDYGVEVSAQNG